MKAKTASNVASPPIGQGVFAKARMFQRTDALRWVKRGERHMLQQAWYCTETGDIEWRDVPFVSEKSCPAPKQAVA